MAEIEDYEDGLSNGVTQQARNGLLSRSRMALVSGGLISALVIGGGYWLLAPSEPPIPLDPAAAAAKKREDDLKKARNAKYEVLFAQLTSEQSAEVLRELSRADIMFRTNQSGKNFQVSVPEDRIEEAKMLLAAKGVPAGSAQGYEVLDAGQTLGVTEFDKRVRYVRALEGEIQKSIKEIDVIENCKVKVVLPEQRLFSVTQPPVTAAVMLVAVAGKKLTDDVVFSVIQYVSSSVENLQPDNVTVVDSRGRNLSNGIFERMAARDAGIRRGSVDEVDTASKNSIEDVASPENARPIVPDYKQIDQWYQVKEKYELTLIERASKQLVGVLPVGSFKVAITAEIGPLSNGEIVDIKRLTTSIVVDNNREDIDLTDESKRQIFNTVAASIGYVRGRDVIILNRADFSIMFPEEKRKLEAIMSAQKNLKYWLLGGAVVVSVGLFAAGVTRLIRRRRARQLSEVPSDLRLSGKDGLDRESDFSDIQTELEKERRFDQVRDVAMADPEILAQIMEEWLGSDSNPAARMGRM